MEDDDLLSLGNDEPRAPTRPPPLPSSNKWAPVQNNPSSSPQVLQHRPAKHTLATQQVRSKGPLVLAIDYGTTRTGIAYALGSDQIQVIRNWGASMSNEPKVKSAISYTNEPRAQVQWGFGIDDHRVEMVNTKLELEPQTDKADELDLTLHVLKGLNFLNIDDMIAQGPNPEYSSKPPVDIVSDYLEKIYIHTQAAIKKDFAVNDTSEPTPIDLVLTIPVNWSYVAQDSIFKAVRRAGFNKSNFPTLRDTILMNEPEAASFFTAQDLRDNGRECFKEGDCFVLCDAGGGTVDVVSYQVKKLRPDLVLEKATEPDGAKCGSALIDRNFKEWLREVIGENNYQLIDPANAQQHRISPNAAETKDMRDLIKNFVLQKHRFSNLEDWDRQITVELPQPLKTVSIPGRVHEGSLTISRKEMKDLMDPCVNGALSLIKKQIEEVSEKKGQRVWNVLLVGGFGGSPYLHEELERSLKGRGRKRQAIGLHLPSADHQSTAVVQGAVIYGLEKARHADVTYLSAYTRSYGIVINDKFHWLIRKGDLTCSNKTRTIKSVPFWQVADVGANSQHEFPIYRYDARNDRDDAVPETWQEGRNEVEKVKVLKCDLSKLAQSGLLARMKNEAGQPLGPLMWQWQLSATNSIEASLLYGNKAEQLGEVKFKLDVDSQPTRVPVTLPLPPEDE